jgi:DNA-directed RNA polymerase specialized sigma subunit
MDEHKESPTARNARLADELGQAQAVLADDNSTPREVRRAKQRVELLTAELWTANFPLVARYANKFDQGDSESLEAYYEAGRMALAEAIMRWDADKGKLSTWAWPQIKKAVLKEVGRKEHRLKAHAFAARPLVLSVAETLRGELVEARKIGNVTLVEPTVEQIADRAELPVSLVRHVMANEALGRTLSLNAPAGDDGAELGDIATVREEEVDQTLVRFADMPVSDLRELSAGAELFEVVCGLRRLGIGAAPEQDFHEIGATWGVSREAARKAFNRFSVKMLTAAGELGFAATADVVVPHDDIESVEDGTATR